MSDNLQHAIAAIRSGDKEAGKRLLAEVIRSDPRNETAWLWMSAVIDSDEHRRTCLERVLAINPRNEIAQRGLEALKTQPLPRLAAQPNTPQRHSTLSLGSLLIFVAIGFIAVAFVAAFLIWLNPPELAPVQTPAPVLSVAEKEYIKNAERWIDEFYRSISVSADLMEELRDAPSLVYDPVWRGKFEQATSGIETAPNGEPPPRFRELDEDLISAFGSYEYFEFYMHVYLSPPDHDPAVLARAFEYLRGCNEALFRAEDKLEQYRSPDSPQ